MTGDFAYASDLWMDDMLWGVTLRSPHPHARILRVDITEALRLPGVFAVLTHDDVPGQKSYGLEHQDQPVLAIDVVRYQGEPVALVAADHPEVARQAAKRIVVDYEVLEPVVDAEAALRPDSPLVHPGGNLVRHVKVRTGDPEPDRRGRRLRRLPGRHAGPGVPRTRSPGSPSPTASAASTCTSPPSGCTSTSARSARPSGCGPSRSGSSWPGSAARSAAARTCRCTCTAACSRCTPASR